MSHHKCHGSNYNIRIQDKMENITTISLFTLSDNEPMIYTIYTSNYNRLDNDTWRHFKKLSKKYETYSLTAHQTNFYNIHLTFEDNDNTNIHDLAEPSLHVLHIGSESDVDDNIV